MSTAPVLLTGGSSKGLEKSAYQLAAELLCRRKGCASPGRDGATPSGFPPAPSGPECADCRRARAKQHPDLLVAAPEVRRRRNVPDFEEGSGSKETTIPTALVRALASEASRHPYEAACRVLVLLDVDRTEAQALNALLKVLEEPPRLSRFVLTATRPRRLPATILSRVVPRRVPVLSRDETAAALRAHGTPADEAEARASFAPGDVDEALELDLAGARERRDAVLAGLSGTLLNGSTCWALTLAGQLAGEDAAQTAERLALAAQLLRDAAAAGTDPAGSSVVHRERYRDLARLSSAGGQRLADAALRALELSADLVEGSRNVRLAAEGYALALLR